MIHDPDSESSNYVYEDDFLVPGWMYILFIFFTVGTIGGIWYLVERFMEIVG